MQIQGIVNKHKGVHAQEVNLAIHQLLNKVKMLNLVPSFGPSSAGQSKPHPQVEMVLIDNLKIPSFFFLIKLELSSRLDELKLDQFRWIKPKILKEDDKFYSGSSDDLDE
ncbi:unnamed protein product [Lactuca saligna]|uniref:Uncharacterized protein n=1 Tax=Lactuca saligna TaxID=75948 RepID=A0AA35ZFM0_LACSI|nr:unnamed protein product [Lactuca saligna]